VLPLKYSIQSGKFIKSFFYTWLIWSMGFFFFGLFLPAIAKLTCVATGITPDITGGTILLGVGVGWLPGFIFAIIGSEIHYYHSKHSRKKNGSAQDEQP
jgi:hypothetical protein